MSPNGPGTSLLERAGCLLKPSPHYVASLEADKTASFCPGSTANGFVPIANPQPFDIVIAWGKDGREWSHGLLL